nr:hypothetical protein [uncultured Cohaesibacter sp.]
MALEIDSREELRAWLEGKPKDWAQAIAVRAALRVFPMVFEDTFVSAESLSLQQKQSLILQVYRATFISWAARKYPAHDMSVAASRAANVATRASIRATDAANAAIRAATFSAQAIDIARATTDAANAAAIAAAFADADAARVWVAISADCEWLEQRGNSLIDQPIWLDDVRGNERTLSNYPVWVRRPFDRFAKSDEWGRQKEWGLILSWYRSLLPDSMEYQPRSYFGEKADIKIATQPDDFWTISENRSAVQILREVGAVAGIDMNSPEELLTPHETDDRELNWSERIVSYLLERGQSTTLGEIRAHFRMFDPAPADTTLRGRLSDLAKRSLIVRIKKGVYIHPNFAKASSSGDAERIQELKADIQTAIENVEPQAPAAYRFAWQNGKVEAVPIDNVSTNSRGAQAFLDEARRKGQALAERLEKSNAAPRVRQSIYGLMEVLPPSLDDLNEYLLRSRAMSVEADAIAYSKPSDELDLFPDAVSGLLDLSGTLRSLQGFYPQLLELDISVAALELDPRKADSAKETFDKIVDIAETAPEVSGASATEALETVKKIAEEEAAEPVRHRRIAEYGLVVRNYVDPVVRAALDNAFTREAKRLGTEVYKEARPKIVKGASDGLGDMARPITILAISGMVALLFGPAAGAAAAAGGFGKIDKMLGYAMKWLKKGAEEDRSEKLDDTTDSRSSQDDEPSDDGADTSLDADDEV